MNGQELEELLGKEIERIGRSISYGIRTTDFQYGLLVGEAIGYRKILENIRENSTNELLYEG